MTFMSSMAKPVGPLPLGAWLAGGVGGLAIGIYRRRFAAPEAPAGPDLTSGFSGEDVLVHGPNGEVLLPDPANVVLSPIFQTPDVIVHNAFDVPAAQVTVIDRTMPAPAPKPAPAPMPAAPPPPAPAPAPATRSYTVKSGDTLWGISAAFYGTGTLYMRIYNANAGVIEATARAHGRSSSAGFSGVGHWIYPGTVLVIP